MYFVYILYSTSADTFYVGHTDDLLKRLNRHNSKLEPSTRRYAPWILLWSTSKNSRNEAVRLELKLKNLSRKRKISFMLRYAAGISSPDELKLLLQLSGC
ncbi:GIY-YIG nuclease family protein [Thermaurantimonas aggregans]|uniref:GIY-YIG nuclease family protein n=1 Tax=Thermaurantimonas aggregans TaxID=2173829 RepID=UPI000F55D19B|nr:GIY-YIG nuclease family protein [Thermaurantimonas aggregans]MCX8148350.1 GIY-YIG nuclease family protein [Thermaurantimonas aggregans]MCX8148351.1 GIY-YIG nuclease family protein [Thermaurantimonas aggregans]